MNSSDVNRAIRTTVRPVLEKHGFVTFTARTAGRYRDRFIEVINFQSFNRYNADVMGCTTYSFALNAGIFLSDVPSESPVPERSGRRQPNEYHCHIRRRVYPPRPMLASYPDMWSIDSNGTNLIDVVRSAASELEHTVIPWFAVFADSGTVLKILLDELPPPDELTWLPGALDSAVRNSAVGYVALAQDERTVAAKFLTRALEQFREFDVQSQMFRTRSPRTTPQHLEKTVERISGSSA